MVVVISSNSEKNLEISRKLIMTLIIIFLAAALAYYQFVRPPYLAAIKDKNKKLRSKKVKLRKLEQLKDSREEINHRYKKIHKAADYSTSEQMLIELEPIITKNNLKLLSYTPARSSKKLLTVTVSGSYKNIYKLLKDLKNLSSQLNLRGITIKSAEENLQTELRLGLNNSDIGGGE